MVRENYHTHTYLCRHAVGKIEDYVKEAIKHNFHSLGISDHGPLENSGFKRMTIEEFYSSYLADFKKCYDKYRRDPHDFAAFYGARSTRSGMLYSSVS